MCAVFLATCGGALANRPASGRRLDGLKEGQQFRLRDGRLAKLCRASNAVRKNRIVEVYDNGVCHANSYTTRVAGITMGDAAVGDLVVVLVDGVGLVESDLGPKEFLWYVGPNP